MKTKPHFYPVDGEGAHDPPGREIVVPEPIGIEVDRPRRADPTGRDPGKDKPGKPGKDYISKSLPAKVSNFTKLNSVFGTGKWFTANQKTEIENFFIDEIRKAMTDSRRADKKYLEKERERYKKIKAYVPGDELTSVKPEPSKPKPPKPKSPKPKPQSRDNVGNRYDGGVH